ncbi:G-protein coupled receptor Mth2 [Eumeta japonica]|uniref:G-protein coupled receptor Mth2 n=1 Tax=Eumeta variegata TaxID=151549 RepID=A0A4C1Z8E6_EUMVA|nr:G-protein coupled receptor Mth2 [Eumeta japonica]
MSSIFRNISSSSTNADVSCVPRPLALRIARIKQQTAVLQSRESATHDQHRGDKQRLLLYVKLFLVMGINWLLEVASALYPDAKEVWKYTDAYNVLIGFTIFVIFVCKKKIFRLMKKRVFERSQERTKELQSFRNFNNVRANWRSNGMQRGSFETIRTVLPHEGRPHVPDSDHLDQNDLHQRGSALKLYQAEQQVNVWIVLE